MEAPFAKNEWQTIVANRHHSREQQQQRRRKRDEPGIVLVGIALVAVSIIPPNASIALREDGEILIGKTRSKTRETKKEGGRERSGQISEKSSVLTLHFVSRKKERREKHELTNAFDFH